MTRQKPLFDQVARQTRAATMMAAGLTPAEIHELSGVGPKTLAMWCRDPGFLMKFKAAKAAYESVTEACVETLRRERGECGAQITIYDPDNLYADEDEDVHAE